MRGAYGRKCNTIRNRGPEVPLFINHKTMKKKIEVIINGKMEHATVLEEQTPALFPEIEGGELMTVKIGKSIKVISKEALKQDGKTTHRHRDLQP